MAVPRLPQHLTSNRGTDEDGPDHHWILAIDMVVPMLAGQTVSEAVRAAAGALDVAAAVPARILCVPGRGGAGSRWVSDPSAVTATPARLLPDEVERTVYARVALVAEQWPGQSLVAAVTTALDAIADWSDPEIVRIHDRPAPMTYTLTLADLSDITPSEVDSILTRSAARSH